MIKKDSLNERPKYNNNQSDEENSNVFDNTEEASTFWRSLWEKSRYGNANPEWLDEIGVAVDYSISDNESIDKWELISQLADVIRKKRNWSALDPDRTANHWVETCLCSSQNNLMESQQRGAKSGCSGTIDDLLIDGMVTQDCVRGKRNTSMAWIDVKKAYDSIDHKWLSTMMVLHKFPCWINRCVKNLCSSWNTRIVAKTKNGAEISETI